MNILSKIIIFSLVAIDIVLGLWILLHDTNIAVLQPAGIIAEKQKHLLVSAVILSLVIIVPVLSAFFFIAWKYRASNTKNNYLPTWDQNTPLQLLWWALPFMIIFILGIMLWHSTHELDPYKPLQSTTKPLKIQVVALQWKWLFIYPQHNIATVNFIAFPKKTPIEFELTADAPMNSFWIPNLGGQIYAMEGMVTKLHLMADKEGEFPGYSAEISGEGFATMKFIAKATTEEAFQRWVEEVKQSQNILDNPTYDALLKPSEHIPPTYYALVEKGLYTSIVMKYMSSQKPMEKHTTEMEGMNH